MKRVSKILNIVGIMVLIISFVIKDYNINRLIELLLGVILLEISLLYKNKRKMLSLIIYPGILIIFLYFIDLGSVYFFNYNPILAHKVVSSKDFVTYNSLIYRKFECNNKEYLDWFYQKSNYCSTDTLEEKDINSLSSEIVHDFNNYKNKFLLINAKVSYKEGTNNIELKSYNNEVDNINGNVIFNDNIVFKLEFNNLDNVNDLKVYDNVKIVGRIFSIKNNKEQYTITIKDAYIPSTKIYNNYKINVVEEKNCQKDKAVYVETANNKFYTSCLSNIYIIYDKDEVYELSYALKDEKIKLNSLLKGYKEIETQKFEENKYKLYKFDSYNILACDEKNFIIGNDKLSFDNNYCEVSDNDINEL